MEKQPFDEIGEAIIRLRHAFLKHGLKPPTAIELGSYDDGARFRYMAPREMMQFDASAYAKGLNAPEWVGNFYGVEIRMPAQWRADLKGRRHAI